ncbi:MAG: transglutaminase family protein, partial [Desulfobacteraceae bacterium]|nr:transglutaminase family protein [Desulfobacteraceae bacterium]
MVDYKKELQYLDNVPWEAPDDPELQQFLEPSKPYKYGQYDDPKVREFTEAMLRRSKTPGECAVKFWQWAKDNVVWVYEPPKPVWEMIEIKEANCMNRSNLFVTQCRLCKIPARFRFFKYYHDLNYGPDWPVEIVEMTPINAIVHISVEAYIDDDWVDFDNWDDRHYKPFPQEHNGRNETLVLVPEQDMANMGQAPHLIADVLNETFEANDFTKENCQKMIDPYSEFLRSLSDKDMNMLFRQFYGDERNASFARMHWFSALGLTYYTYTRYEVDDWETEFAFRDVFLPRYKPSEPTKWPMEDECEYRPADRKIDTKTKVLGQDPRTRRQHLLADFQHFEIITGRR